MTDPVLIDWTTVALSWLYGWGTLAVVCLVIARNPKMSAVRALVFAVCWPVTVPITVIATVIDEGL